MIEGEITGEVKSRSYSPEELGVTNPNELSSAAVLFLAAREDIIGFQRKALPAPASNYNDPALPPLLDEDPPQPTPSILPTPLFFTGDTRLVLCAADVLNKNHRALPDQTLRLNIGLADQFAKRLSRRIAPRESVGLFADMDLLRTNLLHAANRRLEIPGARKDNRDLMSLYSWLCDPNVIIEREPIPVWIRQANPNGVRLVFASEYDNRVEKTLIEAEVPFKLLADCLIRETNKMRVLVMPPLNPRDREWRHLLPRIPTFMIPSKVPMYVREYKARMWSLTLFNS